MIFKKIVIFILIGFYPYSVLPANLFMGFEVSQEIQTAIEKMQTLINQKTKYALDIKNNKPSNLYVSLVYIGEVDDKLVDAYKKIMQEVALISNPFQLQDNFNKSKIAFFGLEKQYLVLELTQHLELTALVYNLKTALTRQGLSFDKSWDTYKPHITLGTITNKQEPFFKNLSLKPTPSKAFQVNKIFLNVKDAKNQQVKSYYDLQGVSMASITKRLDQIDDVLSTLNGRIETLEKSHAKSDTSNTSKKSAAKA